MFVRGLSQRLRLASTTTAFGSTLKLFSSSHQGEHADESSDTRRWLPFSAQAVSATLVLAAAATSPDSEQSEVEPVTIDVHPKTNPSHPWFRAFVSLLPHPDKAHKGGEDAYVVSSCGRVLGVADGVGGWAARGGDPSIYSNGLMNGVAKYIKA